MANFKKIVLRVCDNGCDFSGKKLERRIAVARRKYPKAELLIRLANR